MLFLKEHLQCHHYNWINETNISAYNGKPSRRLFDRFNGDQVLFIINSFAAQSDKFTTEQALEVEQLIINQLPLEAKSEISVFNWLSNFLKMPAGKQVI